MRRALALLALMPLLLAGTFPVPSKALRGRDNAACRSPEAGPAVQLQVNGLKDRTGILRLELYPANDKDFLAADKVLIAAGKVFKRVDIRVPASGTPVICIRAPYPGRFAIALLHDRDANGKFGFTRDGVAFPGNPRLGTGRPAAAAASVNLGGGVADMPVKMQYLRGLRFGPLG